MIAACLLNGQSSIGSCLFFALVLAGLCLSAQSSRGKEHTGRLKTGTAVAISPTGLFLTNFHVIDGCLTITLWLPGHDGISARVLKVDDTSDIALLAADTTGPVSSLMLASKEARSGDRVSMLAFAADPRNPRMPTIVNGTIVGMKRISNGRSVLVVNAPLNPGASGGAVVDKQHRIVGLIFGRLRNRVSRAVAVPISALRQFVGKDDAVSTESVDERRGGKKMVELLNAGSALIQCS